MKVLKDRVLISVTKESEMKKTESGLMLPENVLENGDLEEGVVINVGPGVEGVEEGDRVYIYRGAGKEFKIEGEIYRTVSSAEIVVVL